MTSTDMFGTFFTFALFEIIVADLWDPSTDLWGLGEVSASWVGVFENLCLD